MRITVKLVDLVSHAVLIAFVVAVLSIAAASSLLRHYLPNINDYRDDLLEQVNARNKDIVIDAKKIRSEWKLFQPEISLYDVSVKSGKEKEDLHLEVLQIKLNFIKSLLRQELCFDYIEVSDLDIQLAEDENGRWNFANLQSKDKERQSLKGLVNRLWSIDELVVHNLHLSLLPYGKPAMSLPILNGSLSTYRSERQFLLEFVEGKRQLGRVILETKNKPFANDFSAKAYVKLNDYPLADLASLLPATSVIKKGVLANEIWINWRDEHLAFNGKVTVRDVAVERGASVWQFNKFSTAFYGSYDQQEFVLGLPGSDITILDNSLSLGRVKLTYTDKFQLQVEKLDMAEANKISRQLPLPEALKTVLDTLLPRGELKKLDIRFGQNQPFQLKTQLQDVSVNAWHGAPELLSVNGYLEANKEGGFVEFDTRNFSMFFPAIYKKPMLFDKAKGYVDWQLGSDTIIVSGKDIKLDAAFGQAHGEFVFSLPRIKTDYDTPRLSLLVGMKNTEAKYRDVFIPFIVSENLQRWLDKNIRQGNLPEVGFIYHGPTLKEAKEKRVIQLWLDVKEAVLTFADQWPAIEQINGEFLLDDSFGFASVDSAKTLDLAISHADFLLSPNDHGQLIEINAESESGSRQVFDFLKNQALVEKMGHVIDEWKAEDGKVAAKIAVAVQLGVKTTTHVRVDSDLEGFNLQIPQYNIHLHNIAGKLAFDSNSGLSSDGLEGSFLGKPVSATIESLVSGGKTNTSLHMRGQVAVADFARWSRQPLVNFLTGEAQFDTEVYYGAAGSGLRVSSDLQGVAVNLPKPFLKDENSKRELKLHMPFGEGSREMDVFYGEGVNAHFLIDSQGIEAGTINLGLNKSEYQNGKIILGGQMLEVDVQQWLDVIARYEQLSKSVFSGGSASGGKQSLVFMVENLQIKTLKGYNQTLDSVTLDLFNTVSYWELGLDHHDLKATLKIYEDSLPMELHLHRVNLEFLSKKQAESGVSYASSSWSKFPDINVVIDKLISSGEDYGEWEFKVRSYDTYMALENIQASFKALRLTSAVDEGATLYWTLGDRPQSHFKGKFVGENIANVLKAWGYKQEVQSEKAEFFVESSWDGVPADFEFNNMIAKAKLSLEKGTFADISSAGTDALKFIGVFNIANLVKRLQLDFSDLTSSGLSYDTVTGNIAVDHGVYQFEQPLLVQSSASKIRMYGGFDMNMRQLDMTMGVTLPLASNLPWIVALAGGLPTAAGVYIISKVLDKQVDQISSAVYRVTGPFDDPEIKFDSLFDSEDGYEKQRKKAQKSAQPAVESPPE